MHPVDLNELSEVLVHNELVSVAVASQAFHRDARSGRGFTRVHLGRIVESRCSAEAVSNSDGKIPPHGGVMECNP